MFPKYIGSIVLISSLSKWYCYQNSLPVMGVGSALLLSIFRLESTVSSSCLLCVLLLTSALFLSS